MIGKLIGKVDEIGLDSIIVLVNGVGYIVHCATRLISSLRRDADVSLVIETCIKENEIKLIGFVTQQDKDLFVMLNSVSGVGIKMALCIMSMSSAQIYQAISSSDTKALMAVQGIGKKTAERIIFELKGRKNLPVLLCESGVFNDAVSALVNLGLDAGDAYNRVQRACSTTGSTSLDEIIRTALALV